MDKCGEQTRAADQPDIPNDLSRPSNEPQNKEVILANRHESPLQRFDRKKTAIG